MAVRFTNVTTLRGMKSRGTSGPALPSLRSQGNPGQKYAGYNHLAARENNHGNNSVLHYSARIVLYHPHWGQEARFHSAFRATSHSPVRQLSCFPGKIDFHGTGKAMEDRVITDSR